MLTYKIIHSFYEIGSDFGVDGVKTGVETGVEVKHFAVVTTVLYCVFFALWERGDWLITHVNLDVMTERSSKRYRYVQLSTESSIYVETPSPSRTSFPTPWIIFAI